MRVSWPGGAAPISPQRNAASGAGSAFALAIPPPRVGGAQSSVGVGASVGLSAMLAVQAADTPTERRRRAVRRAHDLLDRLDELRFGLLDGAVPMASLQALRPPLGGSDPVDEPGLRAVLEEIELRIAVELAKLQAGSPGQPLALEHDVALGPPSETLLSQQAHSYVATRRNGEPI